LAAPQGLGRSAPTDRSQTPATGLLFWRPANRVSRVGLDLITVEARVVAASIATYREKWMNRLTHACCLSQHD